MVLTGPVELEVVIESEAAAAAAPYIFLLPLDSAIRYDAVPEDSVCVWPDSVDYVWPLTKNLFDLVGTGANSAAAEGGTKFLDATGTGGAAALA